MQRLSRTLLLSLLLVLCISATNVRQASAVNPDGGSTCVSLYDGKTYRVGSDNLKKYRDSPCSSSSQCSTQRQTRNGNQVVVIKCTAPTSSGGTTSSDTGSTSDSVTADSGQIYEDPAFNASVCSKDNCDFVDNYINPAITLMTALVGIAVTIGIIWGGIQVSTSAGDPQKTASGKGHIQNAIIALVAYAVLFAFLQFIIPGGFL